MNQEFKTKKVTSDIVGQWSPETIKKNGVSY